MNQKQESIAIVGMSCRFPGEIDSPETYWEFICSKGDGISKIPADRWSIGKFYNAQKGRKGKHYTQHGGFLANVDRFDADFFKISPREATYMDPQQRILLELTWEALEDGGILPYDLSIGSTGVYVGLFMHDYTISHYQEPDLSRLDIYSGTGVSPGIAASRISNFYNFKGPSLVIDTACSSSLVAAHYACRDLLSYDADAAIVGGVNLTLIPEMYIALSQANMLAPDGYCKTFDARADGYARSEGAAIVVLKRLSDAEKDGDVIYATILGSAVNQDGCSEGLTVPSSEAQMAVIHSALSRSGVRPDEVQYVEAHGTGTEIGDPIEARSLGGVFSIERKATSPLKVGSVKTNIGHTESAAGIAGLIKAVLMLRHHKIPPNLHFREPNPSIPFEDLKIEVPVALEDWSCHTAMSRIAGVNSFGFGGTNAHAILEEYKPVCAAPCSVADQEQLVVLSAQHPAALKQSVERLLEKTKASFQNDPSVTLRDIACSTALNRTHHPFRKSVLPASKSDLTYQLKQLRDSMSESNQAEESDIQCNGKKTAFIFSGMGQQWPGMGRYLYSNVALCKDVIDRCDVLFQKLTNDWSVAEELVRRGASSRINETRVAQPCIFTLQIALYELWRALGIKPDYVAGHSVGEIAAAYCAGILNLKDAVAVAYHRSRLQQATTGRGKMLAIGLSTHAARNYIDLYADEVEVAAINGPQSIVLSGNTDCLEHVSEELESQGVFNRFLNVDVPYHSFLMDSILDDLEAALKGICPQSGHTRMVSTVTGDIIRGNQVDVSYWRDNVRKPVLFKTATEYLLDGEVDCFLEISSHPVLAVPLRENISLSGNHKLLLTSLRRSESGPGNVLDSLGRFYQSGFAIDWRILYNQPYSFVSLPRYPWRYEPFWNESQQRATFKKPEQGHPLLGLKTELAIPVWESTIDQDLLDAFSDHSIFNSSIYPASAFVEMAVASVLSVTDRKRVGFSDLAIEKPLVLQKDCPVDLQLVQDGDTKISIYSRCEDTGDWQRHFVASVETPTDLTPVAPLLIESYQKGHAEHISQKQFYQILARLEFGYGPGFQQVEEVWKSGDTILAKITNNGSDRVYDKCILCPTKLDAAIQPISLFSDSSVHVPSQLTSFDFYGIGDGISWSYIQLTSKTETMLQCDVLILDAAEQPIAKLKNLICSSLNPQASEKRWQIENNLYRYQWLSEPLSPGSSSAERSPLHYCLDDMQELACRFLATLKSDSERMDYLSHAVPGLNALTKAFIAETLKKTGWDGGDIAGLADKKLCNHFNVIPEKVRLFRKLTANLNGQNGKPYDVKICADLTRSWNKLLKDYPSLLSELALLKACGTSIHRVLSGEEDALELLFARNPVMIGHMYRDSPFIRHCHLLTKHILRSMLRKKQDNGVMRVLEIGAGTGGLTTHLLPEFSPFTTQYWFTDVSSAFLTSAAKLFKEYNFVRYLMLDIEQDPELQGYQLESFDLILASDVLHATSDLKKTLSIVRQLLKPNGLFIFTELTRTSPFMDLIFGSLKDWWSFTDKDIRVDSPLLAQDSWLKLLNQSDFNDCCCFAEDHENAIHSVFVGKRARDVRQVPLKNELWNGKSGFRDAVTDSILILSGAEIYGETLDAVLDRFDANVTSFNWEVPSGASSRPVSAFKERTRQEIKRWLQQVNQASGISPVIVHLPQDAGGSKDDLTVPAALCLSIVDIIKLITGFQWETTPRLVLVTYGVHAVDAGSELNVLQSPVWGLKRTVENEHPDLAIKMIDLAVRPSKDEIEALGVEIVNRSNEDEIAIRGTERYVNRLLPFPKFEAPVTEGRTYSLVRQYGYLNQSFAYQQRGRTRPAKGQVEVEVHSVAMNFKDLAMLLGLIPVVKDSHHRFLEIGYECSGVITEVGEAVDDFHPGQEVFGLGWGCYSKHVHLNSDHIVHKPEHLSATESSTIPIAFLTAYYALIELARLKRGEKVLIHTASGGVGLAAIQIAQEVGAEIYTTAGSGEKREFLRALRVRYVGDSRSLAFAEEILSATDQVGVDVVINTLPGRAVDKSLEILRPFSGRFIDISNFHNETKIDLKYLRKGVATYVFDLEQMALSNPSKIKALLGNINKKIAQKKYGPLPFRIFSNKSISSAFNCLKRSQHIGKICIEMQDEVDVIPGTDLLSVDANSWYLIAGGYGGFGFATAEWLIKCGARKLSLIGRTGEPALEVSRKIKDYQSQGLTIDVAAVDITDLNQLKGHIKYLTMSRQHIAGVIHAAMVMNIGILMNQNANRFREVIAPKITGAWNLHQVTLNLPLDFFILYSSVTSVIGFPGQAAYSASNYFLNQLALYRQAQQLPGTSICWGAIDVVGYLKRNEKSRKQVIKEGFLPLDLQDVWNIICFTQRAGLPEIVYSPVNWQTSAKYMTSIAKSARFDIVQSQADSATSFQDIENDPDHKTEAGDKKYIEQNLKKIIRDLVADSLKFSEATIDCQKTFEELNFDSLLAVELGVRLNDIFGVDLPKVTILQTGLTVNGLIELVRSEYDKKNSLGKTQNNNDIIKPLPEYVNLLEEAILPEDIVPAAYDPEKIGNPKSVFLTGATGFLGAYLLKELLERTNADIYCLVRAVSKEAGRERIEANLKRYHLFDVESAARIIPIRGDLSRAGLALSANNWSVLCERVDIIYHAGARLNFAQPYSVLMPANVQGTVEIIRLATTGKTKPLCYVSSMAKLAQTVADPARIAEKSTTLNNVTAYDSEYIRRNSFNIGYHQTKWVSDELVLEASYKGLPTIVFRPSLISGDSRSGVWNTNDYICQLIKGCLYLGAAPVQEAMFDFCPVDYVAKSIVYLSGKKELLGGGVLLKNPRPISWHEFVSWFTRKGHAIELINPGRWLHLLNQRTKADAGNPLAKLLPLFELRPLDRLIVASPTSINSLSLLEANTTREYLKNTGIQCVPADDRLLTIYLDYLKRCGFLV